MILKIFLAMTILGIYQFPSKHVGANRAHSVPFPSKGGDSCNMVQVNCGAPTQSNEDQGRSHVRHPGPPGKKGIKGDLGPVGPIGPRGLKGSQGAIGRIGPLGPKGDLGQKGDQGTKGEKGDDPDAMRILKMMSARSCQELNEVYGVSTNGYYPMRINVTGDLVSRYCDFTIYEGVSNCEEFILRYNISTYGFYRLRSNVADEPTYHRCGYIYTCKQMLDRDPVTLSGTYILGSADNQYSVYCNFAGGEAITEVRHNSMSEVLMTSCESPGCYSKVPQYTIGMNNIVNIIENSRECRQFIKARCKGMVTLHSSIAWWISRDGQKMNYWGGATSRRDKYCACGETGTCADNNYKCNCDKNEDGVIRQDEGFLTDKTKLPVKELRFGDMGASSEQGWHTLGPLQCMG